LDITAFIRELLFGHDCVIIPGFGGFIGNYTPAHIDKITSTFYPPVKQISFNRNLNHNDGLLIAKISESQKMNYGEARQNVEEYVSDLKSRLSGGEKVVFDKIGSFINNREGNVQFEPEKESNYLLDSYGLTSFQCVPLDSYDVRKRVLKHISKEPVPHVMTSKNLKRAAVIIPLILALIIIPLKTDFFNTGVELGSINPLAAEEFEDNTKALSEGNKVIMSEEADKNGQAPVEETVQAIIEPVKEEVVTPQAEVEGDYFLITGSFKSEANALSQAEKLKGEGFTPEIHGAPNGFYRVCAMKCKDLSLAVEKKDSISKKFPGAWIKKI
jgi:nucleoid DNA-binding protein